MTIGVGILASDGVVVAADSQESVQGYWKTDQGKVQWCGFSSADPVCEGACVVTGAGSGRYLDALQDDVLKDFGDVVEDSGRDWESHIRGVIRRFHRENIVPFLRGQDPPQVNLIIATQQHLAPFRPDGRRYLHGLWATDKSVLARYEYFTSIGIGSGHASNLLHRLWKHDSLDVVSTAILAAFVVFHVKDYVDGCGNYTDLIAIRHAKPYRLTRDQTAKLESVFARMSRQTESLVTNYLIGRHHDDFAKVSAELNEVRAEFLKIVSETKGPYDVFGLASEPAGD